MTPKFIQRSNLQTLNQRKREMNIQCVEDIERKLDPFDVCYQNLKNQSFHKDFKCSLVKTTNVLDFFNDLLVNKKEVNTRNIETLSNKQLKSLIGIIVFSIRRLLFSKCNGNKKSKIPGYNDFQKFPVSKYFRLMRKKKGGELAQLKFTEIKYVCSNSRKYRVMSKYAKCLIVKKSECKNIFQMFNLLAHEVSHELETIFQQYDYTHRRIFHLIHYVIRKRLKEIGIPLSDCYMETNKYSLKI